MVKTNKNAGRVAGKGASQKFGNAKPSTSKANAAGYEKRHSRKAKTLAGLQTSDVYEYVPEKARRSKVGLDLDREEAAEFGTGLDGANEEDREALHARLIGENDDDEMIDSEDDEEIDSDAAFEESDEERFAGFFSAKGKKKVPKKKRPAVHFADVDLNEEDEIEEEEDVNADDDEEEEEGDDDEFIDLLDVLDGKGEVDMGSDDENAPKHAVQNDEQTRDADEQQDAEDDGSEEEDSEKSEEDEDEDEKMDFAASDDEDVSPEALDDLQNFVSTLDPTSKKRKAPESGDAPEDNSRDRSRKRRFIKERTEAGAENEFRVQSSGAKLNLDDLLAPLASQSSALLSLKKSTKFLAPSSSSKAKTLSAPLPQRVQERLDREAAYEQTKEEVDKWSSTMKRIREAEHLSFPLQAEPAGRVSNMELAAKFKPTTALESSVDALLKSAKIREEEIQHTEESMLQMNKLSVEEVAQRRGELRKMRELMFRAEIKARRVGKIKSKTYRKIKRKERERLGEKIDDDDEGSETEEGKLKRETERAKERATLRHKHTGKWAKQMKHRELDGEGRKEIEEMLSRGEKLRRRIRGIGSDESEGDAEESEDDDENEDIEGGIERIKQGAFEELRRIEMEDGSIRIEKSSKGKSVFEMKFMKDAMAREQTAANKVVDDFVKEMGGQPDGLDDSDAELEDDQQLDPSSGVVAHRAGGRIVYRPGANPTSAKERPLKSLASDTSSVTLKSTDLLSPPPPSPEQRKRPNVPFPSIGESNPWLVRDEEDATLKAPRKNNDIVVGKDSKAADKSKNKLKKQARKREEERVKAKDDAAIEISMDQVLLAPSTSTSTLPPKKAAKQAVAQGDDSDVNSEVEAQEKALDLKVKGKARGPTAFAQRDLVARAFAGDNVVQDFEDAKRREIAADAPKEVDTTIAGWGSWGGSGVRKAAPKPQRIKKIAGVDPSSRADFNKKHVIISEKRDKKAAKYLVKDLPYPYTSQAQFERTMERPLGAEWNTRVGFQRGTLPRVVKKPGVIINPLEKLL